MILFWLRRTLVMMMICGVSMWLAVWIGRGSTPGKRLAYTIYHNGNYQLSVLDISRMLVGRLPRTYPPYQNFYGWSEDGHFAFLSDRDGNTEVYVWDGFTFENISQHPSNDWGPAMSRDGRVAFASERDGNMEIYVWDAESGLTNVSQAPGSDDYPIWSSDGRLAWIFNRDANTEIYVWENGASRNVSNTHYPEYRPRWSPDGRLTWFAFRDDIWSVMIWDDDSVIEFASRVNLSWYLTWSHDGRLAYTDGIDIHVGDGETTVNISNSSDADYAPAWIPGGDLAFLTARGGQSDLYAWDGTDIRLFWRDWVSIEAPAWMP